MFTLKNRVLPVAVGAAVLVGAANLTAYAANGHALLLGHDNNESHTATVVNHGPGAALSVVTRDDTPPFAVSSPARVKRLNADRVDGMDGGTVTAYTYQLSQVFDTGSFSQRFPHLPRGKSYVASYWLQADMNVADDGITCELDALKRSGDPGGEDVAISDSPHGFGATAGATGFLSTRNRSVTLDCATDSHDANIGSVFFGQVTFVPIGKQHQAEAVNVP